MTIDNEQLISLLAERTGRDQDQIDEQFAELVSRIRQAEAGQGPLNIDGFGTFECVDDSLQFKPADVLKTEINNKYTGMRPIELIGAFKEPDGEDVPVADLPEEHEVLDYNDLPEDQQQVSEDEVEQVDSPDEKVPEPDQNSEVSDTETLADTPAVEEHADKGQDKEEATAPEIVQKEDQLDEADESDPLGKTILILAIIIALAVAGWMAYDLGLFVENSDKNGSSSELQQGQTENMGSASSQGTPEQASLRDDIQDGEANTVNASTGSAKTAAESNESAAPTVEDRPYGLYGDLNQDISTGYFTIVVHSLRTMDLAKEKMQGLVEEGFRTNIKEASVNERNYFRVGIGQFPTIEAAQQELQELPEPYKSNNFITRF